MTICAVYDSCPHRTVQCLVETCPYADELTLGGRGLPALFLRRLTVSRRAWARRSEASARSSCISAGRPAMRSWARRMASCARSSLISSERSQASASMITWSPRTSMKPPLTAKNSSAPPLRMVSSPGCSMVINGA